MNEKRALAVYNIRKFVEKELKDSNKEKVLKHNGRVLLVTNYVLQRQPIWKNPPSFQVGVNV